MALIAVFLDLQSAESLRPIEVIFPVFTPAANHTAWQYRHTSVNGSPKGDTRQSHGGELSTACLTYIQLYRHSFVFCSRRQVDRWSSQVRYRLRSILTSVKIAARLGSLLRHFKVSSIRFRADLLGRFSVTLDHPDISVFIKR